MYSWENTVDPAGCNAGRDRYPQYFLNIFYASGDQVKIEVILIIRVSYFFLDTNKHRGIPQELQCRYENKMIKI